MVRLAIAACSIGLIAVPAAGASEAKTTKRKADKVEYLRAAGSGPPPAPVKQGKVPAGKGKKATQ